MTFGPFDPILAGANMIALLAAIDAMIRLRSVTVGQTLASTEALVDVVA
jgi:hypothetical protein